MESPEWHQKKLAQMNAFYEKEGRASKKDIKDANINELAKGLLKYLRNREKDAFIKGNQKCEEKNKTDAQKDDAQKNNAQKKKMYAKARRNKWCIKYEHTGSVYEGVKANDDIEFDLMFVMNSKQFEKPQANHGYPGFFNIIQKPELRRRSVLNNLLVSHPTTDDKKFLSPELVMQRFESMVTKYLNYDKQMREEHLKKNKKNHHRFVVRRHGPAIQVDFYEKKDNEEKEELWYHVDLVPCYIFEDEKDKSKSIILLFFKNLILII